MATGVKIDSQLIEEFNEFKLRNTSRYMIFRVSDDKTQIIVESTGPISATYADFKNALPKEDCRYAVVNYEYDMGADGKRSKIVFVIWSPESSPIKSKMLYAGTKNDLKKVLVGVSVELQGTDLSEIDEEEIRERLSRIGQ